MERIPEIGCTFHTRSRVLICESCRYGLHTGNDNMAPVNHFKTYHNAGIESLGIMKAIFAKLNTACGNDIQLPNPFEPPIPYLKIEYGWYCRRPCSTMTGVSTQSVQCQYLSHSTDHFLRHQNKLHRNNNPADFLCQKVLMQSFFPNTYKHWFPVSDLTVYDHRPLYTQRPAWGIPIEKTISHVRQENQDSSVRLRRSEGGSLVGLSGGVVGSGSLEEHSTYVFPLYSLIRLKF